MDVTVVIPTFRRGTGVRRSVESALGQEGVETHVILVDDASRDSSRDALASFESSRLRVIEQPRNGGAPAARQRGTEAASSRWVAYLDDDDVWATTHLQSCLNAMAARGARWSYGGVTWVTPRLEPLHLEPMVPGGQALAALLAGNALVTPSALVVERDLALEIGGWDPRLRGLGDWDFALRLAAREVPAVADRTVLYVRHEQAMSRTALATYPAELALVVEKHSAFARSLGGRIGTAQLWLLLAREYRAAGLRRESACGFARAAVADRRPANALRALKVLLQG